MIDSKTAPYAAMVLRVSLGLMFLAHSVVLKIMVFTLPGTAQFFGSLGLPEFSAYLVVAAEIIGGTALVLGVKTRLATILLLPVMFGAVWVHSGNGWVFSAANGGWEYPVFLTLAMLVQIGLGSGAYALTSETSDVGDFSTPPAEAPAK